MKIKLENKQPTQLSKLKDFWDKKAREGYFEYKDGERYKLPDSFEEFYEKHKDEFRDALDVGCGPGKFLIPMLQDGLNVTGLDVSNEMLNGKKGAKANLKKAEGTLKGKVRLVEGESKELHFSDASFDFVFAKGSIHHNSWKDIQKSFKEVSRVLKSGQFFIFQGRSTKDSALLRSKQILDFGTTAQDPNKEGADEHYFTEQELRDLAKENGFEIVLGPEEIIREREKEKNARWWVVYRKL